MTSVTTKNRKEQNKNNFFQRVVEEKFLPAAGKVANQNHLASIRDGFAMIIPLMIAGAFSILINQVFFGDSKISVGFWIAASTHLGIGYTAQGNIIYNAVGSQIIKAFSQIGAFVWNGTYMILSLFIAFLLGFLIGSRRGALSPVSCGIISLAVFFVTGGSDPSMFSTQGLFPAIIISFLASEFFVFLHRVKKLQIKLPPQVPPSVGKAFSQLLPAIITLLLFAVVSVCFLWVPSYFAVGNVDKYQPYINNWAKQLAAGGQVPANLPNAVKYGLYDAKPLTLVTFIYKFFTYPVLALVQTNAGGLGLATFYIFGVTLFWFFGLHGDNIMLGVFAPIWLTAMVQNTNLYIQYGANAKGLNVFVTSFFDSFTALGGWGGSLSLLIITLIMGRDERAREVSKFAMAPGIFNINEPVTFAYPLMLNPILMIPAFVSPMVMLYAAWLCIGVWQIVPHVVLLIPWISPPGIGALLATLSWQGLVLALFNLLIAIVIYIPFIFLANAVAKREGTYVSGNLYSWIGAIFKKKNRKSTTQVNQKKIESMTTRIKLLLAKNVSYQNEFIIRRLLN